MARGRGWSVFCAVYGMEKDVAVSVVEYGVGKVVEAGGPWARGKYCGRFILVLGAGASCSVGVEEVLLARARLYSLVFYI